MKPFALIRRIEDWIAYVIFALMTIVVISATIELAHVIVLDLAESAPGRFFMDLDELFEIFGLFLMVLIGLELLASIVLFLEEHVFHVEAMLLVALTAITRKIVILDATEIDPLMLFGLGFLLIALAIAYLVIRRMSISRQRAEPDQGHDGVVPNSD